MKFQSVIRAIMHGHRFAARAGLCACVLASSACMSIRAKKHTYAAASSAVNVNGADIRMQVKPEGTEGQSFMFSAMIVSVGVATFDGPFRWRIEALGDEGKLESVVLHRIHTRTGKSKRDEWYPASYLGKRADFKVVKGEAGKSKAVYPIPGMLKVKPHDDGDLEVSVDMTVTGNGRKVRKTVRFRMDPAEGRQDEFVFLPSEIVNNIGKDPSEWEESGWD